MSCNVMMLLLAPLEQPLTPLPLPPHTQPHQHPLHQLQHHQSTRNPAFLQQLNKPQHNDRGEDDQHPNPHLVHAVTTLHNINENINVHQSIRRSQFMHETKCVDVFNEMNFVIESVFRYN
ncbi:hypothetical protein KSF78_0000235 [Schistosoma japonicum]|nr:hypothetical protein KSF78_0000235 [Schistosoma japonicum]